MKTRQHFLYWLEQTNAFDDVQLYSSRFYDIKEPKYVFDILDILLAKSGKYKPVVEDFISLEKQRYEILKNEVIYENSLEVRMEKAIRFASMSDIEKRQSIFRVNSNLSHYLAQSKYPWDEISKEEKKKRKQKRHYFIIPSFLPIMPKEVYLSGLNALLLDLINFEDEFSYPELFDLVMESLDFSAEELDFMLIEFLSNQILYYGTIIYVKHQK